VSGKRNKTRGLREQRDLLSSRVKHGFHFREGRELEMKESPNMAVKYAVLWELYACFDAKVAIKTLFVVSLAL